MAMKIVIRRFNAEQKAYLKERIAKGDIESLFRESCDRNHIKPTKALYHAVLRSFLEQDIITQTEYALFYVVYQSN